MKKITLLLCVLSVSFGFAQTNLEDLEGAMPSTALFDGFGSATVLPNPDTGNAVNTSATALELITDAAGNPWQGAKLIMQTNKIDMTTANKTMTVDVYSTTPRDFLFKLSDGDVGGVDPAQESKTAASHTGSGWETLSLDFNVGADLSQPGYNPPNDQFSSIIFFPLFDIGTDGWSVCCTPGVAVASTTWVDNISGIAGDSVGANCFDGIMNGSETGVDCGGPDCDPCQTFPATAAPTPTAPLSEVLMIYGDTGGYTAWIPDYSFGTNAGEIDLGSGSTNNARVFELFNAGYGEGTDGGPPPSTTDVSSALSLEFDYWADANSTEFSVFIIDNDGAVTEFPYQIADSGGDAVMVKEAWTHVSVPMSFFAGFDASNFFQWKLDASSDLVSDYVYLDNLYFRGPALSTNDLTTTQFNTYPNPSENIWNIKSNNVIKSVTVYDVLGKQVTALTPNATEVEIDGTTMTPGLYFARIEGENGSETVKLIKE